MRTPGFSAEAALCRGNGAYNMIMADASNLHVHPQMMRNERIFEGIDYQITYGIWSGVACCRIVLPGLDYDHTFCPCPV